MSFTTKLEKVRFVAREQEQDTVGVLFSSSLPLFSKASLSGCRQGWDACASGPNFFFLLPNLPRVGGDVPDIHRCRSTCTPSDPAPVTLTFHQPLERIHNLAKKVPKVYTWPPSPPGDHNPFPQSDRDQGQDKSDYFSEQEDEMCGQTAILSDYSRFC